MKGKNILMFVIDEENIKTGRDLFFEPKPKGENTTPKKIVTPHRNLIQMILDKKDLKQRDLQKIIQSSRENLYDDDKPIDIIHQGTISKWTNKDRKTVDYKTIKELFSEQHLMGSTRRLGLHWFALNNRSYLFPLFNIIVLTPGNADLWFEYFTKRLIFDSGDKNYINEKDCRKLAIFILEFVEFEMDWIVPESPNERMENKTKIFIEKWISEFKKILSLSDTSFTYSPGREQMKLIGCSIATSLLKISPYLKIPKNYLYRGCGICDIFNIIKKTKPKTVSEPMAYAKKLISNSNYESFVKNLTKECSTNLSLKDVISTRKVKYLPLNKKSETELSENEQKLSSKIDSLHLKINSLEQKIDQLIYSLENNRNQRR